MVPSGQCSLFQRGKSAWKFLTPTGNSMPVCWIGKQLGIQNPPSDTGFFQAQVYNSTLIQQHRNSELFRSMTHQKSVIQQYKYDLSSESSPVTYLQDCYEHRQWMSFPRSTAFAQGARPDSSAVLGRPWPWRAERQPPGISFSSGGGKQFCHVLLMDLNTYLVPRGGPGHFYAGRKEKQGKTTNTSQGTHTSAFCALTQIKTCAWPNGHMMAPQLWRVKTSPRFRQD